jgi:predicted TIM-barrel fold metal-dependent hydrolase
LAEVVIDISVLLGGSPRLQPDPSYGTEAVVEALLAHDVSTALVAHWSGANATAEIGNNSVLEVAGTSMGLELRPVGTLNPRQYLDWPAELDRVVGAGAVAMRFFPDVQDWPVASEAFHAILEGLRGRCPILVPVTRFGAASVIGAATERLEMPVVLLGAHYTQLADCLAAARRWPHLYLETSRLGQFRGVETVVRELGEDRLLFGSGAPLRPIQASLNAVLTADITDDARRAILAGNAARIFGLAAPELELPQAYRAERLVDVHAHVGSLGFAISRLVLAEYDAVMSKHGIRTMIASSLRAIVDDARVGNRESFEAAQAVDNLLSYVVVNPNDSDGSCLAMDRAYATDLAVGAKLHSSWAGQPTASPNTLALLREVARRRRPLKIHVDGPQWTGALATVANEYPDWKLIVAHAGPGTASPEAAHLVAQTRNVYLELATTTPDLPVIKELVARVGPERLLFGTDAPLIDPAYVLGIYADAGADLSQTSTLADMVFEL